MTAIRTCECGCGHAARARFINGHQGHLGGAATNAPFADRDARFVGYYTGAADKRNGRPLRVDRADTSTIGELYNWGYDAQGAA